MKMRWTTVAFAALALVLLLAATPAFAGGQGAGDTTQARTGTSVSSPGSVSGGAQGDCTQDQTRDQTRDQLQDGSCDVECDGTGAGTGSQTKTQTQAKTQTKTQTQTQTQLRDNASEEASGTATQTRAMIRARTAETSGVVSADEVVAPTAEPAEAQEALTAGNLLGQVFQAMTHVAARVFAWLGLA